MVMNKLRLLALIIVTLLVGSPLRAQSTLEPTLLFRVDVNMEMIIAAVNVASALSPDGSLLAWYGNIPDSSGKQSPPTLHLWDAANGDELATVVSTDPTSLAFNADSSLLAVAGEGGNILIIDVQAWRDFGEVTEATLVDAVIEDELLRNFAIFEQAADIGTGGRGAMVFHGDSSILLMVDFNYSSDAPPFLPVFWDISEPSDMQAIMTGDASPDRNFLTLDIDLFFDPLQFSASDNGFRAVSVEIEDESYRYSRHTIDADFDNGAAVVINDETPASFTATHYLGQSADGDTVLTANFGETNEARLLQLSTGKVITLPSSGWLLSGVVSPSGRLAAAIGNEGSVHKVHLWDIAREEEVVIEVENLHPIDAAYLAFSSDDRKLVLFAPNVIQAWDLSP
jgi:WD40 repeat protein